MFIGWSDGVVSRVLALYTANLGLILIPNMVSETHQEWSLSTTRRDSKNKQKDILSN